MIVFGARSWLAGIVAIGIAATAAAQSAPIVPDRAWYPEGYQDLRIAAALQVEDFPRDPLNVLSEDYDNPRIKTYDLIDCNLGSDLPEELDNRTTVLSMLALDVARMRSELASLGYRREIYDEPLLEFERAALAAIEETEFVTADGRRVEGDEFGTPAYFEYPEGWVWLSDIEIDYDLLGALELRRKRQQPRQPEFIVEGGCGAGEEEFEIRLVPANGELWLINAFAFRVCERKVADPWNHRACGWTQYQQGDTTFASGRYMYEARWGSTVRRGARVLQADFDADETGAVVFRRD